MCSVWKPLAGCWSDLLSSLCICNVPVQALIRCSLGIWFHIYKQEEVKRKSHCVYVSACAKDLVVTTARPALSDKTYKTREEQPSRMQPAKLVFVRATCTGSHTLREKLCTHFHKAAIYKKAGTIRKKGALIRLLCFHILLEGVIIENQVQFPTISFTANFLAVR